MPLPESGVTDTGGALLLVTETVPAGTTGPTDTGKNCTVKAPEAPGANVAGNVIGGTGATLKGLAVVAVIPVTVVFPVFVSVTVCVLGVFT